MSFDLIGLAADAGGSRRVRQRSFARWRTRRCSTGCWPVRITAHRWARHWLDLSRFAESHGFEHDYDRPTAYHFRDFVIRAFNADLPFDTFVRWQLAGDELAPHDSLAMMATGFLAAGVHSTQITKNEVEKQRYDELDDMLATTGNGRLRSVGRLRPLPRPQVRPDSRRPIITACSRRSRRPSAAKSNLPLGPKGSKLAKVLVASEGLPPVRLHSQGDDFFKQTYFLRRGDVESETGRSAARISAGLDAVARRGKALDGRSRRPARAPRIAARPWPIGSPIPNIGAGQLVARVIVNRLWQHHLGHGIVATPNDFGARGEPAVASGAARLAGRGTDPTRVAAQADSAADPHEFGLSAGFAVRSGEGRRRSGQPACSGGTKNGGSRARSSATRCWRAAICSTSGCTGPARSMKRITAAAFISRSNGASSCR